METFEYMAPLSVEETLHLFHTAKRPVMVLAGGTQLLPEMRAYRIQPATLLDVCHLDTLTAIRFEQQHLDIGARTTLAELEQNPLLQQHVPLLTEMSRFFATPLVRTSATIGGNIVARAQFADAVVPLLALNATLSLQRAGSKARSQSLASFLTMPAQQERFEELVTQIHVPVLAEDAFWFYRKLGLRKAGSASLASIALILTRQGQRVKEASIAFGAITLTPFRATRTEATLLNETLPLSARAITRCLSVLQTDVQESYDDFRTSASYRLMMGQALLKKALQQLNTSEENN